MDANLQTAEALLRRAANLMASSLTATTTTSTTTTTTAAASSGQLAASTTQRIQEHRRLFNRQMRVQPYTHRGGRGGRGRGNTTSNKERTSTKTMVCLADSEQTTVPSTVEKLLLAKNGLGEKKIAFPCGVTSAVVKDVIFQNFPKLQKCGGYELLLMQNKSRVNLQVVHTGPCTTEELKCLGSGRIYIRPLQVNIPLSTKFESVAGEEEECLVCGALVPLQSMREHMSDCQVTDDGHVSGKTSPICVDENDDDNDDDNDDTSLLTSAFDNTSSSATARTSTVSSSLPQGSTFTTSSASTLFSTASFASTHSQSGNASMVAEVGNASTNVPVSSSISSGDRTGITTASIPIATTSTVTESPATVTESTSFATLYDSDEFSIDLDTCINYCKVKELENPIEILRCLQQNIMKGRELDITSPSTTLEGETNFLLINRQKVLDSALEELDTIRDPRLPVQISFYGEEADDFGGPRREFFRLCLAEIQKKFFERGVMPHLAGQYYDVGLIMAMSTLQNGSVPRFFPENILQELFFSEQPQQCIYNLRKGFAKLGLYQVGKAIPNFLHLFRQTQASILTRRMLLHLLSPSFSEEGSNARSSENDLYGMFTKYCAKAAGGQRGSVSLNHILQFTTGADAEPPLGFGTSPGIVFVEVDDDEVWSYLPTANTCSNILFLPRPSSLTKLPAESALFNVYDWAFSNAYFGRV